MHIGASHPRPPPPMVITLKMGMYAYNYAPEVNKRIWTSFSVNIWDRKYLTKELGVRIGQEVILFVDI